MNDSSPSRLSLTHDAYERLRAELLACRFPPGERLTISELCEELSVSQGAVREALSRLTAEGLVESRPQHGFRVTPISTADLRTLTAARCEIETLCLRRAIAIGDLAWEGRILAAYHELSRTPLMGPHNTRRFNQAYVAAHGGFLDTLVSACDNPWLLRMRNMLCIQSERYSGLTAPPVPKQRDLNRELRAAMEATLARDAGRATSLLSAHMLETAESLARQLEREHVRPGRSQAAAKAARATERSSTGASAQRTRAGTRSAKRIAKSQR